VSSCHAQKLDNDDRMEKCGSCDCLRFELWVLLAVVEVFLLLGQHRKGRVSAVPIFSEHLVASGSAFDFVSHVTIVHRDPVNGQLRRLPNRTFGCDEGQVLNH
jgi:hypothetical protein